MLLVEHESLTDYPQKPLVRLNYMIQILSRVYSILQLLPRTFQHFKVNVVLYLKVKQLTNY